MNVLITWPKTKPLEDYLEALAAAKAFGEVINYRVAKPPTRHVKRCYVVYDGAIRGWSPIREVKYYGENTVRIVDGDGYWPAGYYIVRDPEWNEIRPIPMKGFQGWRYYDEDVVWAGATL
jgi:hypothetical protein